MKRRKDCSENLFRALMDAPKDGIESRWGLVVAGPQTHAEQLAKLADLAAAQMDATGFFNLVRMSGKFDGGVRNRLDHVESLVERALKDLDGAEPRHSADQGAHMATALEVCSPYATT